MVLVCEFVQSWRVLHAARVGIFNLYPRVVPTRRVLFVMRKSAARKSTMHMLWSVALLLSELCGSGERYSDVRVGESMLLYYVLYGMCKPDED